MTDADLPGRAPPVCAQCGTQIAPALLACPSCQRLVHSDALKRLAAGAERTAHAADTSAAPAPGGHAPVLQSDDDLVYLHLLKKNARRLHGHIQKETTSTRNP